MKGAVLFISVFVVISLALKSEDMISDLYFLAILGWVLVFLVTAMGLLEDRS